MGDETVALCAIAKDEQPYIIEWLCYHLALGFDAVYLYDNSDANVLAPLARRYQKVVVVHTPGPRMQLPAYNHFIATHARKHTWCGMLDIDEFIVLRRHASIKDLLRQHCDSGALALNWYMFGSNGERSYRPLPVVQRFQRRRAAVDRHVKSLMRTLDVVRMDNPHFPVLRHGAVKRDTRGSVVDGPFNPDGPTDVAVVHHYHTKSAQEWAAKQQRGRADVAVAYPERLPSGDDEVADPSAWDFYRTRCM